MKNDKRRRDIKSKLIAAICMLLVSTIMMVSTTYAWFTLSTAPEVTGINTTVGANGNLEIALLDTEGSYTNPDNNITSQVGDSSEFTNNVVVSNVTWGNLVDLSDESYGLSSIVLMPAALDVASGSIITNNLLKVPYYGADGRVTKVDGKDVISGVYNTTTRSFGEVASPTADTVQYGVRAIGTSSNRSVREVAFDSNLSQGTIQSALVRTNATNALTAYGTELANLAIKHATDAAATYTPAEVEILNSLINTLGGTVTQKTEGEGDTTTITFGTPAEDGIVHNAEKALDLLTQAAFASKLNTKNDYTDEAFNADMETLQNDLKDADNATTVFTVPTAITDARSQLAEVVAKVDDARTAYQALIQEKKTSYVWADLSPVVSALFDANAMTMSGIKLDDLKTPAGQQQLIDKYAADGHVTAEMTGGVFSEIADLVGPYTGAKTNLVVEGRNVGTYMTANVTAANTSGTYYVIVVGSNLKTAGAPEGTVAAPQISDAYGYVIDLAFRTNATGSNLLLQTEETQRITEESTNAETMGGGSYMSFTAGANFTLDQMKNLMGCINVVFYSPVSDGSNTTLNVLATAKLDMTEGNYTVSGNTIKANLYIVGTGDTLITNQSDAVITALSANDAKVVSALVYLDGTQVTNEHVGIGDLSMIGTMNLQFSSSAELKPMNYSALNGAIASSGIESYDVSVTNNTTGDTTATVTKGADKATAGSDYTFTVDGTGTYTVAVTVGGENVTPNVTEKTYTIPADKVTGAIVITVS